MTIKKNKGGRPKGSRNKLNAQDEIKKALNNGTGLVELKRFLWDMLTNESVSDTQKAKFLDKYWELMKFIHSENLKMEAPEEPEKGKSPEKDIQEGEHTNPNPPSSTDNVARFSFGKTK